MYQSLQEGYFYDLKCENKIKIIDQICIVKKNNKLNEGSLVWFDFWAFQKNNHGQSLDNHLGDLGILGI